MTLDERILEKFRTLPPDKQMELLDFVEFLEQKYTVEHPPRCVKGLLKDLKGGPGEKDIGAVRAQTPGGSSEKDIADTPPAGSGER